MKTPAEVLDIIRSIQYKWSLLSFVYKFSLQWKFQNLPKQQKVSNVEWGLVNEEW